MGIRVYLQMVQILQPLMSLLRIGVPLLVVQQPVDVLFLCIVLLLLASISQEFL